MTRPRGRRVHRRRSAEESLDACPGGGLRRSSTGKQDARRRASSRPRSRVELKKRRTSRRSRSTRRPRRSRQRDDAQEPPAGARSARCSSRRSRASSASIETTPKNAPDRPQLTRRLAEATSSSRRAAFRDKTAGGDQARRRRRRRTPQARRVQQQTQANQADADREGRAQEGDRRTTRSSKNEYPNYAKLDEVLYYLAYEYEQAQRPQERAQGLLRAHPEGAEVEVHPERVPRVRRALLQRSAGRPVKWDLAAQAYKEVIKYPPPRTRSTATPATSSATSTGTRASSPSALNEFKKTIEYGDQFTRSCRTRRSSRTPRAATSSRSTR